MPPPRIKCFTTCLKFPVFPEEVISWAAEEIADKPDIKAHFPPDGRPTYGWFRGWLKRMEFLTGHLRPLEMTRAEWYTEDNLKTYFEVAADVFVKAGVAERNPDFDPDTPYSPPIIITKPHRIASYDETKVELDCTSGGKGKSDTFVRAGVEDDCETIVTKSGRAATAVCGRLGDGKALPVYITFNSGEEFDTKWAPDMKSHDILDADGNGIA